MPNAQRITQPIEYKPEDDVQHPDTVKALNLIERYGGIDGDHHKTWVIDQVARALLGDRYEAWVVEMKAGDEGPNTYEWNVGIAP